MSVLDDLRGGLVVSVQPVENGPLDQPDIIVAMAIAALNSGAAGLRIQGADNVAAVRSKLSAPLIGIVKHDMPGSDVRITPTAEDARALCKAGADIVGVDMTQRPRAEPAEAIAKAVLGAGVLLMADCATVADGDAALSIGAAILGTTLSGYTADTEALTNEPDFALIKRFRSIAGSQGFVMAEGRFNTPALAAEAMLAGADCVTVGSAITRMEHVVSWFDTAIRGAGS